MDIPTLDRIPKMTGWSQKSVVHLIVLTGLAAVLISLISGSVGLISVWSVLVVGILLLLDYRAGDQGERAQVRDVASICGLPVALIFFFERASGFPGTTGPVVGGIWIVLALYLINGEFLLPFQKKTQLSLYKLLLGQAVLFFGFASIYNRDLVLISAVMVLLGLLVSSVGPVEK